MLDLSLFRSNPEIVRESQRRRCSEVDIVDTVICVDRDLGQAELELEKLLDGVEREEAAQDVKNLIAEKEASIEKLKAELYCHLGKVGNLIHDSVPISRDEANTVIRTWGEKRTDGNIKRYDQLAELLGMRVQTIGNRLGTPCCFQGDAVILYQALLLYSFSFLNSKGYDLMEIESLLPRDTVEKFSQLAPCELFELGGRADDQNWNLPYRPYVFATPQHSFCVYHMEKCFQPQELPIRQAGSFEQAFAYANATYTTVSPYRRIELFCITSPHGFDSWERQEEMLKISEEFFQKLGLPYHIVVPVASSLASATAKSYCLEAWFPAASTYTLMSTCSNLTDYQSRRLEIRYGDEEKSQKFVHIVGCTMAALQKCMFCILETYQRDGGVEVPHVLQAYMGGKTFLSFKV